MKKKIYKVLGVMLALAIVMSTCVCAMWNASADTTLEFAMGNVLTNSGEFQINPQTHRATATEALAIADYAKVTIADGWKAWCYAVKSDGKTLSDATGCGNWITGSYTVSTLSGLPDATYFTITVAKNDNADFTVEDIPADVVTFTAAEKVNPTAALFALGNVNTNTGKFVLNTTVNTRATTKKLLAIADYDKVILKDGWKAWFYAYKSDGETLSDTTGNGAWATGSFSLSALAGKTDATYFSITIATANNDALVIKDIPEDVMTLTEAVKLNPTAAMFVHGTIDGSTGKVSSANHRAYLKDALLIEDYEKVTIASGWKAYVQHYDADGNWLSSGGKWVEETEFTTAEMPKDATYFRFTIAKMGNEAFELADIPEDAAVFTEAVKLNPTAAMFVMGTINGETGNIFAADNRAYTKDAIVKADYEKVTIASGWKAYVQHYDADGNWLSSGGKWVEQTEFTTAEMPKAAVYFRFTLAKMDNANFALADIAEDAVVFTEATECTHEYDNDCDAECNLCGEVREVGDHVYENYVSNGDATCEADGTKTGTCACGAKDTIADEGSKLDHFYNTEYDIDCNNCGEVREAPEKAEGETIADGILYVDGLPSVKGLFCVDGDYYFADWGGVIQTNGKYYVKSSYCDLPGGKEYNFGADGKMLDGIVDGILYIDGITASKGIYEIDGDYYFADWGGVIKTDGKYYTGYIYADGLTAGEYAFGADGKMLDGIVEKDGAQYIYIKGVTVAPGEYEIDGVTYKATWGGLVVAE